MLELVGVPKPNSGAGQRLHDPLRVLNFCYTYLKMHSNAELKGFDVESLIIEQIG